MRRERPPSPGHAHGGADQPGTESASGGAPEDPEVRYLREQLRDLVDEITDFFEEAGKNVAAHPAESVLGAMLVGVLIGFLLGRR